MSGLAPRVLLQCRPPLPLGVSDRIFLLLRLKAIFKTVEVLRKKPELSFSFLILPPLLSSQRSRDARMRRAEEKAWELLTGSEM